MLLVLWVCKNKKNPWHCIQKRLYSLEVLTVVGKIK